VDDVTTDLLIIGAGPTGLFSAYYAGFRGLSVAVVDSLPELGGQITAMYPEKAILDVAGFPSVKGRDLVEGLVAQAATADPTYLLDRTATTLEHGDDQVVVTLDDGTRVTAGGVLITSGIGKFSPRPLPAGEATARSTGPSTSSRSPPRSRSSTAATRSAPTSAPSPRSRTPASGSSPTPR